MKRFFTILTLALSAFAMTACEYDDEALWGKVNELESQVNANTEDIATLSALVDALNKGKVITSVEQTEQGYTLTLSDGSTITLRNGEDGDSFFVSVVEENGVVVITLADGRVIRIPVIDYELRTLSFEDADALFEPYTLSYADATVAVWSDLIDAAQYGGRLLYNDFENVAYAWNDEGNTYLSSSFTGPFWNGGHAISNYVLADYATLPEGASAWYELQLATLDGGHDGSENFCVVNKGSSFSFSNGGQYVIDHMWVTNITYTLNSLFVGDAYAAPAGEQSWFKIVATGYNAAGERTSEAEHLLCRGKDDIQTEWERFDLTPLGEVARVEFAIVGSDDLCGEWGLNTPAYFAYDDVVVRFKTE